MVDSRCKRNFGRFEGVVCWKMDRQEKNAALIWTVIRAHNCCLPMKHIISNWACRTLCWRITSQIIQFLVNPLQRHDALAAAGAGRVFGRAGRRRRAEEEAEKEEVVVPPLQYPGHAITRSRPHTSKGVNEGGFFFFTITI